MILYCSRQIPRVQMVGTLIFRLIGVSMESDGEDCPVRMVNYLKGDFQEQRGESVGTFCTNENVYK